MKQSLIPSYVITRIVPSYRSDDVSRIYDVIEYYPSAPYACRDLSVAWQT